MKFFILLGIFLAFSVLGFVTSEEIDDEVKCIPGVTYIENQCNYCACSSYGLECTLKGCSTHTDPKFRECAVGNTWEEGCEKCFCHKIWKTVCTTNCGQKTGTS